VSTVFVFLVSVSVTLVQFLRQFSASVTQSAPVLVQSSEPSPAALGLVCHVAKLKSLSMASWNVRALNDDDKCELVT
jgi:hypothetical protein